MNPDKIVCFPSIDWFHNWERQQELIYRLSQYYLDKEVLIFEPLGLINHSVSGIVKKIANRFNDRRVVPEASYNAKKLNNMHFVDFNFIPVHYVSVVDSFNARLLKKKIDVSSALIWATYVNGFIFKVFNEAKWRVLDLAARRQVSPFLSNSAKKMELEAVKIADVVFVDNHNTYLDYVQYAKKIVYLPQGVDLSAFENSPTTTGYEYLKQEGKKIIGYCGTLHQYIDYNSLYEIIPQFDDTHIFMFVGNIVDEQAHKLQQFKNVIFTGRKNHDQLSNYYKLFDIGLIPYALGPHTSGVFPTKFFEYLVCGVPVLSTALPDLLNYGELDFLKIYHNDKQFINSIHYFLNSNDINKRVMVDFALKNTWEDRFSVIMEELNSIL